jgi:hypothetical protein
MNTKTKCDLIVIDNFYDNPLEIREFALSCEYHKENYYPGKRTISYSNDILKEKIESIVYPFSGKITSFTSYDTDNGCFQILKKTDETWIHKDYNNINWGGVIFLTPDAPINSGTGFYKFKGDNKDSGFSEKHDSSENAIDNTKWEMIDYIGNVFNRLILFNSQRLHQGLNYFGNNDNNGRLIQVFFFNTEF